MKARGSCRWGVTTSVAMLVMEVAASAAMAATTSSTPSAIERLGTVSFATSCAPNVRADINRGVALLHDFWYEESRPQFKRILEADPSCAMAHWGLAMSGFFQLYGEIAPSGPHAVHMPGHIFARLGLWQEDIDSNVASIEASRVADARHESGWMDQFHSDDFLVYAYLQSGQEAQARAAAAASEAAISHYESMPGMTSDNFMVGLFPYYRVKLPAFIALETHDWKSVAALDASKGTLDSKLLVYWVRAIADGHLRQAQRAREDLEAYDALMAEMKKGDRAWVADSTSARINRLVMVGWVAFAEGNTAEALRQMRASADLQDKVGQGEVDIPAREMLADLLLESGKPKEALVEYKQDLKLSPNRFNALFSAGRAAEATGNAFEARNYYAALLKSTDNGSHSTRPEIGHAKAYVTTANLAK